MQQKEAVPSIELRIPSSAFEEATGPEDGDEGRDGPEVVDLSTTLYALILLSGRPIVLLPTLLVSMGQFGVLWLVAWSSPEYFFESGQWIVPRSDYWSVNAMKILSLFLTLFRVTHEFRDATKLYRVLAHEPQVPMTMSQRLAGASAFLLQYAVAVVVLFMAIHLILATTTPIATIGKIWVVFMTLDFDNYLCNFLLFVFDQENSFEWKVELPAADPADSPPPKREDRPWQLFYWGPVLLALIIILLSASLNVCPLTGIHYGLVRNTDPVLMMTPHLGLPQSCCPPQVTWSVQPGTDDDPAVNVSVPCAAPLSSYRAGVAPRVYFVVVPDGRPSPSSLQVLEGRCGDGNFGLRHGVVEAKPMQMRYWLSAHGFTPQVYDAMHDSDSGGLGLYKNSYPYVAEWAVPDFPWDSRSRVFAVAVNPASGSLSPEPAKSNVLIRKICPAHCDSCDPDGACLQCETGFVLQGEKECLSCAANCVKCELTGAGSCDDGGCEAGHGLTARRTCLPCAGSACLSCDVPLAGNSTLPAEELEPGTELTNPPCRRCADGYGLVDGGTCAQCQTQGCKSCTSLDLCEVCIPGLTLYWPEGEDNSSTLGCRPCADHCDGCDRLGPGKCDPERCQLGYGLTGLGSCAPCSAHCTNCSRTGTNVCDAGQCRAGYGLQGSTSCSKCQVSRCDVCDTAPDHCDACAQGYGLTPEQTCEACAASCRRCTGVGDCAECLPGFGLSGGKCLACADQCLQCDTTGPGQCDTGHCQAGWETRLIPGEGQVCVRRRIEHRAH